MKCKHCTHKDECADDAFINDAEFALDVEHECAGFEPFTNAERIRAMSDEELAETLIRYNDLCDMFMADDGMKYYDFEAAKEAELEWLQQPAEGE